ncbi:Fur family ferric uptake transcriptional regulator [Paucibacter oligotrophus]|uniref:Ferric uptake regulation protein n=1 Tax=Roseateles oligotrophus TaxID=1769250 RepID=A0A840L7F0_9BURK|nr:Fur family transcriptional regulator [Roseateles oligotrophus]MBB4843701.1 Fur family ferric uptake transcriptional regulator [Roseateles oligotrophus]
MERSTRQRTAIYDAIAAAGRPLSALEVLEAARVDVEGLGIATVYRNLKLLLEDGSVTLVQLPSDGPRYELTGHAHHHHFQCTCCQRVFDVHQCPGDLAKLAPPGFSVERHEITLYGHCEDCQAPVRKSRSAPKQAAKPGTAGKPTGCGHQHSPPRVGKAA